MFPLILTLSIFGFLLLAWLVTLFVAYRIAFYHKDKKDMTYEVLTGPGYDPYNEQMINLIKRAVDIPFEEVRIKSKDGLTLYGRLYIKDESQPVHIQCHGYYGHALRDFSGGLQIALMCNQNVLLVDHRAHGKSEGRTITFGIKEREDVLCWANYVINRFGKDKKIFLEGISMGGATVLMSADVGIPNLMGILADCPYSSPLEINAKVAHELGLPKFLCKPVLWSAAFLYGHFNLAKYSALQSVKNAKCPILIIHGKEDKFVPLEMSHQLKEANPSIELFEFDNASHGMSYILDEDRYIKIALAFFDKCLEEKEVKIDESYKL